jgi:hypothetical protein
MQNGQNVLYWAPIGTAAAQANSSSETSAHIPSFFGLITSRITLGQLEGILDDVGTIQEHRFEFEGL